MKFDFFAVEDSSTYEYDFWMSLGMKSVALFYLDKNMSLTERAGKVFYESMKTLQPFTVERGLPSRFVNQPGILSDQGPEYGLSVDGKGQMWLDGEKYEKLRKRFAKDALAESILERASQDAGVPKELYPARYWHCGTHRVADIPQLLENGYEGYLARIDVLMKNGNTMQRSFLRGMCYTAWAMVEYPEIVMLGKSLIRQCGDKLPFLQFHKPAAVAKEDLYVPDFAAQAEKQPDMAAESMDLAVLLDGPEHPEESICRAAVLESGLRNWRSVDVKNPSLQKAVIKKAMFSSRKRELEQAYFTILFQHMSLSGVTHLVRHRMQSVVIPRYLTVCDFEKYIIPDSIKKAGLTERYRSIFKKTAETSQALHAAGFAECDQVYLLLSGLTIPVMTTMNANELCTFIRLRTCNRAQWEIRDNALALLKLLREKHPVLFSLYGPMCYVSGVCPEGKATCGRSEEVRRMFASGEFPEGL